MDTIPRVLSIAGTDPTGGAGVQADLKSIGAAGGYGMAVVTALVAQNTQGLREIHTPPQSFLDAQLQSVFDDVQVDAIKIGMLGDVETTETVANWLQRVDVPVVVLDPVMVATSGDRLLSEEAEQAVRELTRLATVVTPNLPELAMLVGEPVATTVRQAVEQAQRFAKEMNISVLAKGGHLSSSQADNALVTPAGEVFNVAVERVETKNTHGTGCSLSSALATRLAAGDSPQRAVEWASEWLREAIEYADDLHVGQGNGPVDHFHRLRRLARSNGGEI